MARRDRGFQKEIPMKKAGLFLALALLAGGALAQLSWVGDSYVYNEELDKIGRASCRERV